MPEGNAITPREQQVFDLLLLGYAQINIAAVLKISIETVKVYVHRLHEKTGSATTLEMVANHYSPKRPAMRKRDLLIRQSQLTQNLVAVSHELAILEKELSDENEARTRTLSPHPGGLACAGADMAEGRN